MRKMTPHARKRSAQRNVSVTEIEYVMTYGQSFRRAGALFYYLRRRDIPWWDQGNTRWTQLVGTAVVLTPDGRTVLTIWRNSETGHKQIRSKRKYFSRRRPSPPRKYYY